MSHTVFTQRNFVADFLQTMCDLVGKRPFCVFDLLGSLGATYDVHLIIGKRVVDFLLALIELFFARWYSWGATANIDWKSAFRFNGVSLTHDFRYQVSDIALINHSSFQKTRLNDLSYGIKIWTDLSSILSQCTGLADGQSDGQTDGLTDRQLSRD